MRKRNFAKINSDKIRGIIAERGLKQIDLSGVVFHAPSYVCQCLTRGEMPMPELVMIADFLKVEVQELIKSEKLEPVVEAKAGYSVGLEINPKSLAVCINFDGETIYKKFAKIKGDSEIDLLQAISYAANMIYRTAEQEQLAEEREGYNA